MPCRKMPPNVAFVCSSKPTGLAGLGPSVGTVTMRSRVPPSTAPHLARLRPRPTHVTGVLHAKARVVAVRRLGPLRPENRDSAAATGGRTRLPLSPPPCLLPFSPLSLPVCAPNFRWTLGHPALKPSAELGISPRLSASHAPCLSFAWQIVVWCLLAMRKRRLSCTHPTCCCRLHPQKHI